MMADGPQRTLTIAQLVPEMEAGGVERGTLEVCEALIERGHRAIVVSAGGRMVELLERAGATHITLPIAKKSPLTLRYAEALRRIIEEHGVDIVHARSRMPAWVARRALRSITDARRPVYITTVHGLNSVNWYSRVMTQSDHIVCVSSSAREHVLGGYGRDLESKITVIPRGVDPAEFPFGYRADTDWEASFLQQHAELRGKQILTLPGRVTRLKGHTDFIELLRMLTDSGEDVGGLIIGSVHRRKRSYLSSLRRQIEESGLDDSIVIAPPTDRIRDVYGLSSIVYSLSHTPESFGRTVLEPLTIGVPVIGYDHGGVGEILSALCPGGRVEPRDLMALVERTREFLSDPPSLPSSHSLTQDAMLGSILELYERLAQDWG